MGDSFLKCPSVNPPRRQSSRLKRIKAVYESEDAATKVACPRFEPQDGALNSFFLASQIKVETPIPYQGHAIDVSDGVYADAVVNVEKDSNSDTMSVDKTTLKDLQARCKAKKLKVLKAVASKETDLESQPLHAPKKRSHFPLRPKEEPDLDEPLIILKMKISKKMYSNRKRRKCTHLSSKPHTSLEDRADRNPVAFNIEAKSDLSESYCLVSNKSTLRDNNSLSKSLTAMKKDLFDIHSVKCKIVENASPDGQNTAYTFNVATKQTTDFIAKFDLDEETSELLEKINGGDSEIGKSDYSFAQALQSSSSSHVVMAGQLFSSSSMSELEQNVNTNFSDLVCDGKCEFLETNSPMQNKACITGSAVELMENTNCAGDSTISDENESKKWNLALSSIRKPQCCVNEVPFESTEPNGQGCSPEHIGEPFYPPNSEPLSTAMDLHPNICGTGEEHIISPAEFKYENAADQLNYSVRSHSQESQESMEVNGDADACNYKNVCVDRQKLLEKLVAQEMPTDVQESDGAVNTNMKTNQLDHSGYVCSSSMEDELCDQFAREVCPIDVRVNHDEENIGRPDEHFGMEAYGLCSYEHSQTCFSAANSCPIVSTLETEKSSDNTEQLLDVVTWKDNCHAAAVSDCKDSDELDTSSSRAENLSKSAEPSNIELLIEAERNSMMEGFKVGGGDVEHIPKKLLSNRKTISPTSQEKLYQAVNGIDLYDAMQLSKNRKRLFSEKWYKMEPSAPVAGHTEGDMKLSCEKVAKKPKIDGYGSTQSVTKGILKKSPDYSCRNSCSCTKSAVIHRQSQKAIQFSQMQMKSVRSIVLKLLKGLNSLKDIIEESSEVLPSATLKYTANEITATIENTSKLEASTERFLSLMSKDCDRFCKLMSSAEKTASPINGAIKDGKSITFADEAGGRLCHVKVFEEQEEQPTSVVASKSDEFEQ